MTTVEPFASRKRPSDRTTAFAVSVVLSKPPELTIREYIQLLRQHVAKGRRANTISSVHRYLDRSSYWRAEYERMKDALKSVEDANIDLKLEIESLKRKPDTGKATNSAKKRKKVDEDVILVPRSPKKSKQEVLSAKLPTHINDCNSDFDLADIGEVGNILMRSFYQIHMLLKSRDKTEPAVLAHHLIRAAAAIAQVVQRTLQRSNTSTVVDVEFLKSVLTATSRSVVSLVRGYNRMMHVAPGSEACGHIVYAFVQMYRKIVDSFAELSISEAKKAVDSGPANEHCKRQSPSKAKQKQTQPGTIKDNTLLNLMAKFLCTIMDNLDAKNEAHKALFEGFTYVALNELGTKLYVSVFGHGRGATVEDEIAATNQPDEIKDGEEISLIQGKEVQVRAARLEAPYLVHLLSHIMNVAPAHLGAAANKKIGKAKQANSKNSTKDALTINAKERLQRTLVDCIFGKECSIEEDEFMDRLGMPVVNGPALAMPKIKEADVQEWFKEEVWRLLGWEILAREGDWRACVLV